VKKIGNGGGKAISPKELERRLRALLDSAPDYDPTDLRNCGTCLDRGLVISADEHGIHSGTPCRDCALGQTQARIQRDWLLGNGRWAVLGRSVYWERKYRERAERRAARPVEDKGLPF
jgi:hypothetical protein